MDEMPTCPIFTEDQPDFNPPGPPTKSCRKTVKCCVQMTMLVRKLPKREKRDGDTEEKPGVQFDMVYFPPSDTNEGKEGKARRGRLQTARKLERNWSLTRECRNFIKENSDTGRKGQKRRARGLNSKRKKLD